MRSCFLSALITFQYFPYPEPINTIQIFPFFRIVFNIILSSKPASSKWCILVRLRACYMICVCVCLFVLFPFLLRFSFLFFLYLSSLLILQMRFFLFVSYHFNSSRFLFLSLLFQLYYILLPFCIIYFFPICYLSFSSSLSLSFFTVGVISNQPFLLTSFCRPG